MARKTVPTVFQPGAVQKLLGELRRSIRDEQVLAAIARTPREAFVPSHLRDAAYENIPLPIGHGQTISQPYVVAATLEALGLTGTETVLEVGTGSGYQAVLLSQLARRVVSVERVPEHVERAAKVIEDMGCINVRVEVAGQVLGCPEYGPYDAVVVSAAAPAVPESLMEQLAEGGCMVVPVGTREEQDLKLIVKRGGGVKAFSLGPCRFVPLIGEGAWSE